VVGKSDSYCNLIAAAPVMLKGQQVIHFVTWSRPTAL